MHDPVANLVYCGIGSTVDTVLVDGRVLMEGREVLTLDEEGILAQGQIRARAIAERANLLQFGRPKWPVV